MRSSKPPPPTTPDGRYIVVCSRLWRNSNPHLSVKERQPWVNALMETHTKRSKKRNSRPSPPPAPVSERSPACRAGSWPWTSRFGGRGRHGFGMERLARICLGAIVLHGCATEPGTGPSRPGGDDHWRGPTTTDHSGAGQGRILSGRFAGPDRMRRFMSGLAGTRALLPSGCAARGPIFVDFVTSTSSPLRQLSPTKATTGPTERFRETVAHSSIAFPRCADVSASGAANAPRGSRRQTCTSQMNKATVMLSAINISWCRTGRRR